MARMTKHLGLACMLIAAVASAPKTAQAQYMYGQISTRSTIPVERQIQRRIREAEELIKEEKVFRAIGLLQTILEKPTDSFVEMEEGRFVSARHQAQLLIEGLGADGIAQYRRSYEDQAQEMLRRGLETKNAEMLANVMRQFFLTDAGFDAANYLASFQLDQGRPGIALMYLQRMTNSKAHEGRVNAEVQKKKAVAMAMIGGPNIEGARKLLAGVPLPTTYTADDVIRSVSERPADHEMLVTKDYPVSFGSASRTSVARADFTARRLEMKWLVPFAESTENGAGNFFNNVNNSISSRSSMNQASIVELYPLAIGDRRDRKSVV